MRHLPTGRFGSWAGLGMVSRMVSQESYLIWSLRNGKETVFFTERDWCEQKQIGCGKVMVSSSAGLGDAILLGWVAGNKLKSLDQILKPPPGIKCLTAGHLLVVQQLPLLARRSWHPECSIGAWLVFIWNSIAQNIPYSLAALAPVFIFDSLLKRVLE